MAFVAHKRLTNQSGELIKTQRNTYSTITNLKDIPNQLQRTD